jgi:hypothetical protein
LHIPSMREHFTSEKRQFLLLHRSFLFRVVDPDLLSGDADPIRLLGQLAALLAGVSYLLTFWVIFTPARFSKEFLWSMEHLLTETTMVVVGLFSVLNWDSIFPNKQDVLILAPLPVRTSTLFRAKLSSLLTALALSVLAVNIFSGLLWPFLFSSTNGGGFAGASRSLAAYWITMLLGGLFMLCCVLGVHGVAALFLTRQAFLRLSALLQTAAFFLFFGAFVLEPSLETRAALAGPENQRLLAALPSYWFLGLFQQLNGSMIPEFAPLARRAWEALAIAISIGVVSVLMAYFRTMPKIVEEPDIVAGDRRSQPTMSCGSSLQTCVTLFSAHTLLRSPQHRGLLSFYLGTGFAILLAYVKTALEQGILLHGSRGDAVDVAFLTASIWMICLAILGVRTVSSMPHTLRANWIFRVTSTRRVSEYLSAVRRSLLVIALAPAWLLLAALFLIHWPTLQVAGHLIVLGFVGVIVIELSSFGLHKLPFTCSYLPGQSKGNVMFWSCLFVLLPPVAAKVEQRMSTSMSGYAGMIVLLAIIAVWARRRTSTSVEEIEELTFEEEYPPDILSLGLEASDAVYRGE